MAAAWFRSTISSMFLISRASSMTCWPSTTFMPAFCSSKNIAVSARSTPTGIVGDAGLAQERHDLLRVACIRPAAGGTVPRMPSMPARTLVGNQPVAIEAVVDGGRAEVPDDRLLLAHQQREAAELVALPLADLGRGDIADVVDVEEEQRAALATCRAPPSPAPAGRCAAGRSRPGPRNRRRYGRAPEWRGSSSSAARYPPVRGTGATGLGSRQTPGSFSLGSGEHQSVSSLARSAQAPKGRPTNAEGVPIGAEIDLKVRRWQKQAEKMLRCHRLHRRRLPPRDRPNSVPDDCSSESNADATVIFSSDINILHRSIDRRSFPLWRGGR